MSLPKASETIRLVPLTGAIFEIISAAITFLGYLTILIKVFASLRRTRSPTRDVMQPYSNCKTGGAHISRLLSVQ